MFADHLGSANGIKSITTIRYQSKRHWFIHTNWRFLNIWDARSLFSWWHTAFCTSIHLIATGSLFICRSALILSFSLISPMSICVITKYSSSLLSLAKPHSYTFLLVGQLFRWIFGLDCCNGLLYEWDYELFASLPHTFRTRSYFQHILNLTGSFTVSKRIKKTVESYVTP